MQCWQVQGMWDRLVTPADPFMAQPIQQTDPLCPGGMRFHQVTQEVVSSSSVPSWLAPGSVYSRDLDRSVAGVEDDHEEQISSRSQYPLIYSAETEL